MAFYRPYVIVVYMKFYPAHPDLVIKVARVGHGVRVHLEPSPIAASGLQGVMASLGLLPKPFNLVKSYTLAINYPKPQS